jgi:hypothetical protein
LDRLFRPKFERKFGPTSSVFPGYIQCNHAVAHLSHPGELERCVKSEPFVSPSNPINAGEREAYLPSCPKCAEQKVS